MSTSQNVTFLQKNIFFHYRIDFQSIIPKNGNRLKSRGNSANNDVSQ